MPVSDAISRITRSVAPCTSSEPISNSAGPAVVNAAVMSGKNGHSSSEKPTKKIASQATSCISKITAACPAISRSRRLWSLISFAPKP